MQDGIEHQIRRDLRSEDPIPSITMLPVERGSQFGVQVADSEGLQPAGANGRAQFLRQVAGPVLAGAMVDKTGSWVGGLAVIGPCLLVGFILAGLYQGR